MSIEQVSVSFGVKDTIEDLKARLRNAKYPPTRKDQELSWDHGTNTAVLKDLVKYWLEQYDFLHFIHEKSKSASAVPLLLIHGWPGSVWEFSKILPLLTSEEPGFHVVCPCLPGYGWSTAPQDKPTSVEDVSDLLLDLMNHLGYKQFVVQGGDWGGIIARCMSVQHPEAVLACHLNMAVAVPPKVSGPVSLLANVTYAAAFAKCMLLGSKEDKRALKSTRDFLRYETAYQQVQACTPQTLACAVHDSPVGMLSWMLDKFYRWTDNDGDVFSVVSRDELLTNATIYWTTNTMGPSFLLYRDSLPYSRGSRLAFGSGYCSVPTGVAAFPKEIIQPPKPVLQVCFNLQHHRRFNKGGHFAALERPKDLVGDMRHFFFQVVDLETCRLEAEKRSPRIARPPQMTELVILGVVFAIVAILVRAWFV